MQRGYLGGRRADMVLVLVLVVGVVLVGGFRGWGGVTAAGLRDAALEYAGVLAAPTWGTGAPNTAPLAAPDKGSFRGGGPGFCGCCAGGPGGFGFWGRGGSSSAGGSAPDLQSLEQAALDLYRQQTGDTGPVQVQVRDFGCHLQADVYKDGRLVKSYTYRYGQWQEIY